MHVLARIVAADPKLFLNLMAATATPQKTEDDLYEELLDVWFARVSPWTDLGLAELILPHTSSSTTCPKLVTVS